MVVAVVKRNDSGGCDDVHCDGADRCAAAPFVRSWRFRRSGDGQTPKRTIKNSIPRRSFEAKPRNPQHAHFIVLETSARTTIIAVRQRGTCRTSSHTVVATRFHLLPNNTIDRDVLFLSQLSQRFYVDLQR